MDICSSVSTTVQLVGSEILKPKMGGHFLVGFFFSAKSMAMLIGNFVFKVIGRQPRDKTAFSV